MLIPMTHSILNRGLQSCAREGCETPDSSGSFCLCNSGKMLQNQMPKKAEVSLVALASGVCHFTAASVLYAHVHAAQCTPSPHATPTSIAWNASAQSLTLRIAAFFCLFVCFFTVHKVFWSSQTLLVQLLKIKTFRFLCCRSLASD